MGFLSGWPLNGAGTESLGSDTEKGLFPGMARSHSGAEGLITNHGGGRILTLTLTLTRSLTWIDGRLQLN